MMVYLSKRARTSELRVARQKTAATLLDLAKDCRIAHDENRRWQVTSGTDEIERAIIDVVRKWLFTFCHDLGIPVPTVVIADTIPTCYGFDAAGAAIYDTNTICFRKLDQPSSEYLFTLAHELRHQWQRQNRVPVTEKDADDYAAEALVRLAQPHTLPYSGPILRQRRMSP
jgi:hypothetical protein